MNTVSLIGNIGAMPTFHTTPSGNPVLNFSLAVDRRYYSTANGQRRLQTSVDWFPVVCWNKTATTCNDYLQKGSKVAIQGTLRTRDNINKDGSKTKVIEVKAEKITFLANIKNPETQTTTNDTDSSD